MKLKLQYNFFFILCLIVLHNTVIIGQNTSTEDYPLPSILGNSGLSFVPTAYLNVDRSLGFGVSYLPAAKAVQAYSINDNLVEGIASFRLNYLPFIEASVRLTKSKGELGLGDRSLFFRVQILKENEKRPAFAIGAHDIFGQVPHYHSVYVVASKRKRLGTDHLLSAHLGYGTSVKETANNTHLIGVFGGLEYKYKVWASSLEYDGEDINLAFKFRCKNWLFIQANMLDLKYLSAGLSLQFVL